MAEDVQRPSTVGLGRRRPMEAAERRRADLRVQDDHRGVRVRPRILVIALEEEGLGSGRDRGERRALSQSQQDLVLLHRYS